MHGVTLRYHNSSSAKVTLDIGVMKEHFENQFYVAYKNRNAFRMLIILMYHAWVGAKSTNKMVLCRSGMPWLCSHISCTAAISHFQFAQLTEHHIVGSLSKILTVSMIVGSVF